MIFCTKCKTEKVEDDFAPSKVRANNRGTCKSCAWNFQLRLNDPVRYKARCYANNKARHDALKAKLAELRAAKS